MRPDPLSEAEVSAIEDAGPTTRTTFLSLEGDRVVADLRRLARARAVYARVVAAANLSADAGLRRVALMLASTFEEALGEGMSTLPPKDDGGRAA